MAVEVPSTVMVKPASALCDLMCEVFPFSPTSFPSFAPSYQCSQLVYQLSCSQDRIWNTIKLQNIVQRNAHLLKNEPSVSSMHAVCSLAPNSAASPYTHLPWLLGCQVVWL